MIFQRVIWVFTLASTLCAAGCQDRPQQSISDHKTKPLARVNGIAITAEDVNFRVVKDHGGKNDLTRSLDDVINQELLYQQGLKLGLDKDPSYKAKLADLERQPAAAKRLEIARRVFNTQIGSQINLLPRDGQEYYDKNADMIATELHLQFIKCEDKIAAEDALRKIRSGATFESVARPIMEGREPWNLGFVKWDKIPVDFAETIYRLKTGGVSEILGSQQAGFQIIKVVDRRKIGKIAYPPIQGIVMNRLRDLKLLEAYNQYVEKLRKEAKIEKL